VRRHRQQVLRTGDQDVAGGGLTNLRVWRSAFAVSICMGIGRRSRVVRRPWRNLQKRNEFNEGTLRSGSMVDQAMVEDHLARAERHVTEGEADVARQTKLVAKMEQEGHDTCEARASLALFKEMQELHVADRDRLRKELADISA
jgi:hypothetical protein